MAHMARKIDEDSKKSNFVKMTNLARKVDKDSKKSNFVKNRQFFFISFW